MRQFIKHPFKRFIFFYFNLITNKLEFLFSYSNIIVYT
uniref:Uncharacterized protein n=1 Tax=Herposiphonia versicolor TaxID=2007163 RepID=A0A1Z1MFG7_9FLOR|nr:hypothetical protein [Herposiphonia versicolor]ARW64800.1 hypothetical protein [Herposiphonia versicolor]